MYQLKSFLIVGVLVVALFGSIKTDLTRQKKDCDCQGAFHFEPSCKCSSNYQPSLSSSVGVSCDCKENKFGSSEVEGGTECNCETSRNLYQIDMNTKINICLDVCGKDCLTEYKNTIPIFNIMTYHSICQATCHNSCVKFIKQQQHTLPHPPKPIEKDTPNQPWMVTIQRVACDASCFSHCQANQKCESQCYDGCACRNHCQVKCIKQYGQSIDVCFPACKNACPFEVSDKEGSIGQGTFYNTQSNTVKTSSQTVLNKSSYCLSQCKDSCDGTCYEERHDSRSCRVFCDKSCQKHCSAESGESIESRSSESSSRSNEASSSDSKAVTAPSLNQKVCYTSCMNFCNLQQKPLNQCKVNCDIGCKFGPVLNQFNPALFSSENIKVTSREESCLSTCHSAYLSACSKMPKTNLAEFNECKLQYKSPCEEACTSGLNVVDCIKPSYHHPIFTKCQCPTNFSLCPYESKCCKD